MKEEFIKEINTIKNEALRKVAMKMVEDAPEYFWTVAASSSGKYHPAISLGEGGLVRHSVMTYKIAIDLLEAEIFIPISDDNRDLVTITALFHDIIKRGSNSKNTVFEHPILSADFVYEHLKDADIEPVVIDVICKAISRHMGKWTTCSYSKITLKAPVTPFEKLIHTADYMASRKYIKGLDQWKV